MQLMRMSAHFAGLLLGLAVGLTGSISWAATAPLQGRPVNAVLRQLQTADVKFIYSTALVPDSLLVAGEPQSDDPFGKAREILRPHGLALKTVGPGPVRRSS